MAGRYHQLAAWVQQQGWTRGAELGLFDGRTFLHLLKTCPGLSLIGVDVWDLPGFAEGPTKSGEKCFCPYCNETRASRRGKTIREHEAFVRESAKGYPNARILKMATTDAARLIDDGALDYVFIDADHSTEGVSADIANWRGKLRGGGFLIGHDWNMASVRAGVLQHFKAGQVKTADDHLWYVTC